MSVDLTNCSPKASVEKKIENVTMKDRNGEEHPVTLGLVLKQMVDNDSGEVKKETRYFTPKQEDGTSMNLMEQGVRMYVPFFGAWNPMPTDEQVKDLFEGESIKMTGMKKTNGEPYKQDPEFIFSPFKKRDAFEVKDKNGNTVTRQSSFTGEVEFKPFEKKAPEVDW